MKSYAEIDSLFNVELDLLLIWNTNEVNYFTAATSWIYMLKLFLDAVVRVLHHNTEIK